MKNIFIIHGSGDDPSKHWYPWMKKELEKLGYQVFVPKFPTENGHVLTRWFKKLEKYKEYINKDTIFVAHSRGCSFVMRFLEQIKHPIKAAFFIGGFHQYLWYPKADNKIDSFFTKPFKWKKIKANCRRFEIYHSDNDEWVPLKIGKELAELLGGKFNFIKGAGHFTKKSNYLKFDLLLKEINKNE